MLPPNVSAELQRNMARLGFVVSQIKEIEGARQKRLEQEPETGRFAHVHNRAACKVGPHETRVQAAAHQGEFHADDVTGTMAGFWTPAYVKAIGVPGWHLHFLSDDHGFGGHVLGAAGEGIELAMEHVDDFRVAIPETAAFLKTDLSRDPGAVLDKAEKAREEAPGPTRARSD